MFRRATTSGGGRGPPAATADDPTVGRVGRRRRAVVDVTVRVDSAAAEYLVAAAAADVAGPVERGLDRRVGRGRFRRRRDTGGVTTTHRHGHDDTYDCRVRLHGEIIIKIIITIIIVVRGVRSVRCRAISTTAVLSADGRCSDGAVPPVTRTRDSLTLTRTPRRTIDFFFFFYNKSMLLLPVTWYGRYYSYSCR